MNIKIGQTFTKKCVKDNDRFKHFGINEKCTSIYGCKKEDIVKVELEVIEIGYDETSPKHGEYWGWYSFKNKDFSMIYPSRIQFMVCFIYGPKVSEEAGHGKCVKLKVNGIIV